MRRKKENEMNNEMKQKMHRYWVLVGLRQSKEILQKDYDKKDFNQKEYKRQLWYLRGQIVSHYLKNTFLFPIWFIHVLTPSFFKNKPNIWTNLKFIFIQKEFHSLRMAMLSLFVFSFIFIQGGVFYFRHAPKVSAVTASYYVDFTNGLDSNLGTEVAPLKYHPWMSSSTAGITLQAGDTVYMKRGEQWIISNPTAPWITVGTSGTAGNYIMTTAYGAGAQPLIKINTDSAQNVIYAAGKSFIKFDNLHIQHWSGTAYGPNTQDGIQFTKDGSDNLPHDWIITNNEIDNIPGVGIQNMSDAYNIIVGDINATQTATQTSYSNNIHDYGYAGVILIGRNSATGRSDFSVYYNYVHDANRPNCGDNEYGIMFSARPSVVSAWPAYATARYNRVENIDTYEGFDTHGGSYLYYLDNYVHNVSLGIMTGSATVAGLTDTGDNIHVENNIIEQPIDQQCNSLGKAFIYMGDMGSDSGHGVVSSTIKNNKIFFTTRSLVLISRTGIDISGVNNVEIDGNEFYNSPNVSSGMSAIQSTMDGFSNVTIKNNHFHDWGLRSIYLNLSLMEGPVSIYNNIFNSAWGIGLRLANVTQNLNIYNNIFLTDTGFSYAPWAVIWEGDTDGITPPATVNIKNNVIISYPGTGGYHMSNSGGNMNSSLFINNNLYYNSVNIAGYWFAWQTSGYDTSGLGPTINPLLINSSGVYSTTTDFQPLWNSPLIDAGANVSLTTDRASNPVYGTPDIGLYEYQPPYIMGTDDVDSSSTIRVYANGKYRNTDTPANTAVGFSVSPQGGFTSGVYSAWMDIKINTWNTTSTMYHRWTESNTSAGATVHTIENLTANTYYTVWYTKNGGVKSRLTAIQTDSSGLATFTYDQGYSTVVFEMEEDTSVPTAFTLSSPPSGESTFSARPTFSWNASSDVDSGLFKYQLYIDNILNTDNVSTTTLSVVPLSDLSCGSHSWYVKVLDYAGFSITAAPFNLTIDCIGGGGNPPPAVPAPIIPPPVVPPPIIPPPVVPPPIIPPPVVPAPEVQPPAEPAPIIPPPAEPTPEVQPSIEQSSQTNETTDSESSEQSSSVSELSAVVETVAGNEENKEFQVLSIANIANDVKALKNQIGEQLIVTAIKVKEISDNPEVEKITKHAIAPATVGVSFVAIAPSFASVALPLSRFLFLQPLLFLGMRKRKNWGKVYSSLNKLPLGLAILRLIDVKTNKLVQTRVTDTEGHYGFFVVEPGEYRIEVIKNDFVFPSKFLANDNVDGRMLDIYHGQNIILNKENANIALNIPIDPIEQEKTPAMFIFKKNILIAQNIFSMCGTLLMFVYLLISNTWYIWLFLILHIFIYLLFLKFIAPKKLKGWGIVYDVEDKNPLYKTVVRLFAKKYNKLITFNVTDKEGRYAFLVGPGDYFVTFQREGYVDNQGKELNLTNIKEEKILIKENIGLAKSPKLG